MRQRMGTHLPYRILFLIARHLTITGPDGAGQVPSDQEWQPHDMLSKRGEIADEPFAQAAMHSDNPRRSTMQGKGDLGFRSTTLRRTSRIRAHKISRSPAR